MTQPVEPYSSFRFAVDTGHGKLNFSECTLPSLEVDILEQKEGGYNHAVHLIAGPVKAGRLTLKCGVGDAQELLKWYLQVAKGEAAKAECNVLVTMFDGAGKPVLKLEFIKAYPVKWTGPAFKSSDNAIAIESLELAFSEFHQQ